MDIATLTCLVTEDYRIAVESTDDKDLCLEFIFSLETRRMFFVGKSQPAFMRELRHDAVARNYFDQLVGTPEKLMEFAKKGYLNNASLAVLLESRIRKMFLSVCAIVEKEDTDSFEICVDVWANKFQYLENRIEVWKS